MGELRAMLVAVESYKDSSWDEVEYAEADADGLRDALLIHGLKFENTVLLKSPQATRTSILSMLKKSLNAADSDDMFIFSFAGHGFGEKNKNYITCNDTYMDDLVETSISLDAIFSLIKKSKCKKVLIFLDSCQSGMKISGAMRSVVSKMSYSEFKKFCEASEFHVGLASSKVDESSWSDENLQHGIWTYHVIEAIAGRVPDALEKGFILTTDSLMGYLSVSVPKAVRLYQGPFVVQTPVKFGSSTGESLIFDFKKIFEERDLKLRSGLGDLSRAVFRGTTTGSVKSLPGFAKGNRIPTYVNESTRSFVARIGDQLVVDTTEQLYASARRHFSYSSKEAEVEHSTSNSTLKTKDFVVDISLEINEDDSSQYVMKIKLSELTKPEIAASTKFSSVFDCEFNLVTFEGKQHCDVKTLIEAVELDKRLTCVYESDKKKCTISSDEFPAKIIVTANRFHLRFRTKIAIDDVLLSIKRLPDFANKHGFLGLLP